MSTLYILYTLYRYTPVHHHPVEVIADWTAALALHPLGPVGELGEVHQAASPPPVVLPEDSVHTVHTVHCTLYTYYALLSKKVLYVQLET